MVEDCMREKNISFEDAISYLISVGWKAHRLFNEVMVSKK
ncbi:hypothetical protein FTV88_0130 [Heliorestis convoluta]|uniref:Uncharacterized protein n=1 Tax=Heliorestis convoluta TaxID=356322 RepID=A0A5Q2MY95_9FIRM|nr:hypothetical protein FTV88_0130 [Heliorestis convoluta]